ncbi:MAG: hypothetical protein WAL12_21015 [Trebonia sp.]
MSQNGTATPVIGSSVNVGTAPGGLSVGVFTNTGGLAVVLGGVTGGPVTLQGGQGATVAVPASSQVTAQALPPVRPDLGATGSPPLPSIPAASLSYYIGTLT